MFSLGVRNTISLFNSHDVAAFGAGGNFRIQLSDRVNTEWFADFIKSSTQDLGRNRLSHRLVCNVLFTESRQNKNRSTIH